VFGSRFPLARISIPVTPSVFMLSSAFRGTISRKVNIFSFDLIVVPNGSPVRNLVYANLAMNWIDGMIFWMEFDNEFVGKSEFT
jgi:hypothetical protein